MIRALLPALFLMGSCLSYAAGFHRVVSTDAMNVWAVGNDGLVIRSTDGGINWQAITLGTVHLRALAIAGQTIVIGSQNGMCYRSSDGGNDWSSQILTAGGAIRSLSFVNASTVWGAGDNGWIGVSTDGGQTWADRSIGTSATIHEIVFADAMTGYFVGATGISRRSTDGGLTWSDMGNPPLNGDALSVDVHGTTVYVVGEKGIALKSTTGGNSFTNLKFTTDSQSDVRDVFIIGQDSVAFAGGGGYIRMTTNGGATYRWGIHQMHAEISDVYFHDGLRGWACSPANNAVLRTTDGGATWQLPQGTSVTYTWTQRLSSAGSVRGNTFSFNGFNRNSIYIALGTTIYATYNRGDTWVTVGSMPSGGSRVNSFYVSPKDTNIWVAAYAGTPDRIVRTTNRGATWTATITIPFSEYGMPLEMDGSHPDTLIFGPEDGRMYRSTNFGASWDTLGFAGTSSPCDLVVVRDSANIIWCGDSPGAIFRSTNGGVNWSLVHSPGSAEIPTIAHGSMDNRFGYATAWSGGGFIKTTNYGATWSQIATTGSAWGTDVAKDDPNVIMFGVYGGSTSYLSTNAGSNFSTAALSNANYAILCYDRATFLAQQSNGVYKCIVAYNVPIPNAATAVLHAPNGGEVWQYNSVQNITWSASSFANVRIQYQTSPSSPWQTITPGVPASSGSFAWFVPNTPTTQARVLISDAADGSPADTSSAFFSIVAPTVSSSTDSVNFGIVQIFTIARDTIRLINSGTAPLTVKSIEFDTTGFAASRSSFTIPPNSSDTLSVLFMPTAVKRYRATMTIHTNAGVSVPVDLFGEGGPVTSVSGDGEIPTAYRLDQNYPNPFNPTTMISISLPEQVFVTLRVYDALGKELAVLISERLSAGRYSVPFTGSAENGRTLPSGVFFYRLEAGSFKATRRMVLIK